jgi:hypothetical protein
VARCGAQARRAAQLAEIQALAPRWGALGRCTRECSRLASSGTVARRIHPVTGGAAWCGRAQRGATPRGEPTTFQHRSMPDTQTKISSRVDGVLRSMDCPGAPARRGRPHVQLDWPAAKSRARSGVRGRQPCLSTRGLSMSAQRDRLETRGTT